MSQGAAERGSVAAIEHESPLVAERYRIERKLGRGSSATVYAATDVRLDRPVTVKLFDPDLARGNGWTNRFRQQAAKAARLTHPNIATVLDAGVDELPGGAEQPYVVTEPAGPSSLRSVLDRQGYLAPAVAVEVARQIAEALEHAHHHGVIHADVKPENVLLDVERRQAKLVDFSLSFVSAMTGAVTADTLTRRAAYLAPEQVRGEPLGPTTDVYGLGALLYEMVVGRPPFVGPTPELTAERRVHEVARPAGVFDPSISPHLEAVIGRALQRDPEQRWPSALAFGDALETLGPARLRPIAVHEPVPPEPPRRAPTLRGHTHALRSPVFLVGGLFALMSVLMLAAIVPRAVGDGLRVPSLEPARVEVPDVVGMPLDEARSLARARGLELNVLGERVSDRVARGAVMQQAPVPGMQSPTGPIRVTVSAGSNVPAPLSDAQGNPASHAVSEPVTPMECVPGAPPEFVLGFAELQRHVGEVMGSPLECERTDPASGDVIQHTSTGLAYYRPGQGAPTFTNGWQRWALIEQGVVTWEGESLEPPSS